MKNLFVLAFILSTFTTYAQKEILPADIQIKTALLAAPESYKENATVLGYNSDGDLITLRDGDNGLVCIASNPAEEDIHVACYSDKLADFMERGRTLTAEGKSVAEKQEIRKKEIDNGTLKMPETPAAVYVLTGKGENYDASTGELADSHIRYVFYKPYMTAEETGLPTKPQGPGMPWLMDAETHRSHIMITPPRKKN